MTTPYENGRIENRRVFFSKKGVLLLGGIVLLSLGLVGSVLFLLLVNSNQIFSNNSIYSLMICLIMLIFAVGYILRSVLNNTCDLFEIIVPLTALFALNYPVRALVILLWPDLARFPLNWPRDSEYFIFQALLVSLFGLFLFYVGYFWKAKDKLCEVFPKIPLHDGTNQLSAIKICVIYCVGILAFVMLFRSGSGMRFVWDEIRDSSAIVQLWQLLDSFRHFGLILAWFSWSKSPLYRFLSWSFLATNISIGLVTGSKHEIFVAIFAVLLALNYSGRVVNRRKIILISILSLGGFLIVFFSLVQSYRESYLTILGSQVVVPTFGDMTESLSVSAGNSVSLRDIIAEVVNRAVWFDSGVMIIRWVPDYIDYLKGATFFPLVIGWVPRIIWPDKPILSLGSYMHNIIIGSPSQSNVGFSMIGEFYLNFGVWGVMAGMFVMGIFVRLSYLYARNCSAVTTYWGLVYSAIYPILLFSLQSNIATAILGMIRTILVVFLVIAFLSIGSDGVKRYATLTKPNERKAVDGIEHA